MIEETYQIPRRVVNTTGANANGATPRRKPKPDNRDRVMLRFFLDKHKADERELWHEAESLKKERQFAPTLRDGLRLMSDLRAGRFDALFDLFDWIPGWIETEVERRINERMVNTNDRLARIEAELAMLKTAPALRPVAAPDDDGLLVVTKAKSDGKASAENFLSAAFSLQKIQ